PLVVQGGAVQARTCWWPVVHDLVDKSNEVWKVEVFRWHAAAGQRRLGNQHQGEVEQSHCDERSRRPRSGDGNAGLVIHSLWGAPAVSYHECRGENDDQWIDREKAAEACCCGC